MEENVDLRSQSTVKSSNNSSLNRIYIKRSHLFQLVKWFLIGFNGALIILLLAGVFIYFSDVRDEKYFNKLNLNSSEKATQLNYLQSDPTDQGTRSSGRKYSWIIPMFTFALLLTIPCIGFIGAIKKNTCLLISYGVIFFLNSLFVLTFGSFYFIVPGLIASTAIALVFLNSKTTQSEFDSTTEINSKYGSKYESEWFRQTV